MGGGGVCVYVSVCMCVVYVSSLFELVGINRELRGGERDERRMKRVSNSGRRVT